MRICFLAVFVFAGCGIRGPTVPAGVVAESPESLGSSEWRQVVLTTDAQIMREFNGNSITPGKGFSGRPFSISAESVTAGSDCLLVKFTVTNSSGGPVKPSTYVHRGIGSDGSRLRETGDINYAQFGPLMPGESCEIVMKLTPTAASHGMVRFITGEFAGQDGVKNTRWTLSFENPSYVQAPSE